MGLDVSNNDSSTARCNDRIMTTATPAATTTATPAATTTAATTTTTTIGPNTTTRPVLTRVIPNAPVHRNLHLAMLGCETKFPYGPNEHTAQILMDLVVLGATEHFQTDILPSSSSAHSDTSLHSNLSSSSSSTATTNNDGFHIHIHLFNAQAEDYPEDWDAFDGFLLPGSFSSAYDPDPWIIKLKQVIQTHLVPQQQEQQQRRRPILAICFGHQVLAHSFFPKGKAARMELGARVGRHGMPTTMAGKQMLHLPEIDLYCTHGDNVEQLPDSAVCLGGNERVPIQAAAYFTSPHDADQWRHHEASNNSNNNSNGGDDDSIPTLSLPRPYAISFQAHPEYATSRKLGLERTLQACINAMNKHGAIDAKAKDYAGKDAIDNFDKVQKDSVHVMVQVGRWLGWFPAW